MMHATTLATLLAAATLAAAPQTPPKVSISTGGTTRFVDFSADLARVTTSVVLGELGAFRDGKRERIRDADAHLGSGGTVSRISGTQYFRVKSRTAIEVARVLAGRDPGDKVALRFDVQLARLPDGSEQRQILGSTRTELDAGMKALWVVGREPKAKGLEILHAIPIGEKEKREDFERDMVDFVRINVAMADLKAGMRTVELKKEKDREGAIATIRELLGKEVEVKNPDNEGLVGQHVEPLRAQLRKELEALGGGEDG